MSPRSVPRLPSIAAALSLLAALVGVTGLAVYGAGVFIMARSMRAQLRSDATRLTEGTLLAVNAIVGEPLSSVSTLLALGDAVDGVSVLERQVLRGILGAAVEGDARFTALRRLDGSGRIVLAEPEGDALEGTDLSASPQFQAAVRSGAPVWSPIYAGFRDGRREISLMVPGKTGVLMAILDFETVAADIAYAVAKVKQEVSLVDSGGTYIVHRDAGLVERRAVDLDFVEQRTRSPGADSYEYSTGRGKSQLMVRAQRMAGTDWFVLVGQSSDLIFKAIVSSLAGSAVVAIIFTLGAFAAAGILSRRLLSDISGTYDEAVRALDVMAPPSASRFRFRETRAIASHMASAVSKWRDSDAAREALERLNKKLEAALGELRKTQDAMIEREKIATLGDLVSGIAHEINSPLGAIVSGSNTLELSLLKVASALKTLPDRDVHGVVEAVSLLLSALSSRSEFASTSARRAALRRAESSFLPAPAAADQADRFVDLAGADFSPDLPPALARLSPEALDAGLSLVESVRLSRVVKSAGERAGRVIAALRSYTHHAEKELPVPVDIAETLDEAIALLYNKLKHGVDFGFERREEPLVLRAYPDRLVQVWTNLIMNAGQAVQWRGRIRVSVAAEDGAAHVAVEDDGPGVPEEIRGRLFEVFATTKPKGEGTGLGLAIVKRMVTELGGEVSYSSVPGKTVFTVRLPFINTA